METSSVGMDNSPAKAFLLIDATTWWQEINDSLLWQDHIFLTLAALYGIVAIVALVGSFSLFLYPSVPVLVLVFSVVNLSSELNLGNWVFVY